MALAAQAEAGEEVEETKREPFNPVDHLTNRVKSIGRSFFGIGVEEELRRNEENIEKAKELQAKAAQSPGALLIKDSLNRIAGMDTEALKQKFSGKMTDAQIEKLSR